MSIRVDNHMFEDWIPNNDSCGGLKTYIFNGDSIHIEEFFWYNGRYIELMDISI
jgi:hypothetical protein